MASGRHLKSLRRTSSGQQSTPLRRPVVLFAKLSKILRQLSWLPKHYGSFPFLLTDKTS